MTALISYILACLVSAYVLVIAVPEWVRKYIPFSDQLHQFTDERPLFAHGLAFGVTVLTFTLSFGSLFWTQNRKILLGSKVSLLTVSAIMIVLLVFLGTRLWPEVQPYLFSWASAASAALHEQ